MNIMRLYSNKHVFCSICDCILVTRYSIPQDPQTSRATSIPVTCEDFAIWGGLVDFTHVDLTLLT